MKMKLCMVLLSCCVGALTESPPYNPCSSAPCHNEATCVLASWESRGYYCSCKRGYEGDLCQIESPCVKGNPCRHGGTCIGASWKEAKYVCDCPKYYQGDKCEKVNCNTARPCQHGGRCYSRSNAVGYICYCRGDYYGTNCEKESVCKTSNPCERGGTCIMDRYHSSGYYCYCPRGYGGRKCHLVDPCSSSPAVCNNGGYCSSDVDAEREKYTYHCNCIDNYVGKHCEKESPCKRRNPCKNGGRCYSNDPEKFYCSCPQGFRGRVCQAKRCPVEGECVRNVSHKYSKNPEECVQQEEAIRETLESCHKRRGDAMKDNQTCDCTTVDYADTKNIYVTSIMSNKYFTCIPHVMESLSKTCDKYTLQCAFYLRDASRFLSRRFESCPGEVKHLMGKIQKCHDDYVAGNISFEGCEFLDKAYKIIKDIVEIKLQLACTGCDLHRIGETCRPRTGNQRHVTKNPQIKACIKEQLEANNASCANAKDAVVKFLEIDEKFKQQKQKECEDINSYEQKLEKMGCYSDAESSDVTKRNTEETEWNLFNIRHLIGMSQP